VKKLILVCLTAALLLTVFLTLTACGEKEPSGKDTPSETFGGMTISIADVWGKDLTPGLDDATDRLIAKIKAVEEKYDIKFEWRKIDEAPYWNNMASTIMANTPHGDIMYAFPWMLYDWIKADAVMDISALAKELGIDFKDGTWNAFAAEENTIDGKIFGFSKRPQDSQSGLVYNKKLFAAASLEDPNVLAAQGKWDFATLEQYAKALTKQGADGKNTQWGLTTTDNHWLMTTFVASNGGQSIDFSQTPPAIALDSPKSLEALEVFNRMLNQDKTLLGKTFGTDWKITPDAFVSGTVGMMHTQEWVIEYIRDKMVEADRGEEYGFTYFPKGAGAEDYVNSSSGANCYFLPGTLDPKRARAALLVYKELFAADGQDDFTMEEQITLTAESLFADEGSVNTYIDLVSKKKTVGNGASRVGLREPFMDLSARFIINDGTPQAIIAEEKPALQGVINDSVFVKK